jgi:hypothetical protein
MYFIKFTVCLNKMQFLINFKNDRQIVQPALFMQKIKDNPPSLKLVPPIGRQRLADGAALKLRRHADDGRRK